MLEESTEAQPTPTRKAVALKEILHMDQVAAGGAADFFTNNSSYVRTEEVALKNQLEHTPAQIKLAFSSPPTSHISAAAMALKPTEKNRVWPRVQLEALSKF